MKWKAKPEVKFGDTYRYNQFLIFPRKFNGYWYWLEWVTVEDMWMDYRWTRTHVSKIVAIGKMKISEDE